MSDQGTYVPKAQQTATWRIWNKLYKCRVSAFHARSVEDIEHFGTPASGDSEFDRTMLTEARLYYKTVDQMIELFKRDVPVGLFNVSDAKLIYEDISDHLRIWQNGLLRSPNIRPDDETVNELMLMDRFATTVYPIAAPFFTTQFTESVLLRRMTELVLPVAAVVADPVGTMPAKKDYIPPERESLADIFAARREVSSKTWRGG